MAKCCGNGFHLFIYLYLLQCLGSSSQPHMLAHSSVVRIGFGLFSVVMLRQYVSRVGNNQIRQAEMRKNTRGIGERKTCRLKWQKVEIFERKSYKKAKWQI